MPLLPSTGVITTTVPALTVPTSVVPALTNGAVAIVDSADPQYQQYQQQAGAGASTTGSGSSTTNSGSDVAGVTVINPSSSTQGQTLTAAAPSSSTQQAATAAAPNIQVINPGDPNYEQYAQLARNSNSTAPVPASVAAFDRVDFTPRLAASIGKVSSAERRQKYTAAAAGTIATAAASQLAKARAAAAAEPQVDAAGGPMIKHILHKKEAVPVPAPATQPVVVLPQPQVAAVPTTTTGGIALHTSTPVTLSAPITVNTPVEQKSVQMDGLKHLLGR